MKLAEIIVDDFGGAPAAEHNMPCAICRERKAVLLLDYGRFAPCWECQRRGWRTTRPPRWLRWLLDWLEDRSHRRTPPRPRKRRVMFRITGGRDG